MDVGDESAAKAADEVVVSLSNVIDEADRLRSLIETIAHDRAVHAQSLALLTDLALAQTRARRIARTLWVVAEEREQVALAAVI